MASDSGQYETTTNSGTRNTTIVYELRSPESYQGPFPSFREPTEIGFSSLNSEGCFQNDDSQLKFLVTPDTISGLNMDLCKGYRNAIRKNNLSSLKIDNLLQWIISNKEKVMTNFGKSGLSANQSFSANFVCFRGLLTELVCMVYENKADFLLCATKFQGVIYLCAFHTDLRIKSETSKKARDHLMCSWGYKFEQYMTTDQKGGRPNTTVPVNELEEYNIALKGRLGNNTLLFGAEVDCVDTSHKHKGNSTKKYIELKTSRIITTEKQDWNFCRFKLLKWWAQSFLVGIPKILCGFRDDQGVVQNLRSLRTKEIPEMGKGLWSPSIGMNFCNEFLNFLKTFVVKDDPYVVYKFYRPVAGNIECEELNEPEKYQILPDWYIKEFQK